MKPIIKVAVKRAEEHVRRAGCRWRERNRRHDDERRAQRQTARRRGRRIEQEQAREGDSMSQKEHVGDVQLAVPLHGVAVRSRFGASSRGSSARRPAPSAPRSLSSRMPIQGPRRRPAISARTFVTGCRFCGRDERLAHFVHDGHGSRSAGFPVIDRTVVAGQPSQSTAHGSASGQGAHFSRAASTCGGRVPVPRRRCGASGSATSA